MVALLALISAAFANPFELPGTQPNELTIKIDDPDSCDGCHGGFATTAPNDAWEGSMMANAARDPIYLAALAIANQDHPEAGEFCIRCHSPKGWLEGRSTPPDGSALVGDDFEGVSCDFCHRIVPGPDGEELIGNGQFFVANDYYKRGTYATNEAPHGVEVSSYHGDASLCGLCHNVTNPVNGLAIERTYSEWTQSAHPAEGTTCTDCHLKSHQGYAANAPGLPERLVHTHTMAGGNAFIPTVLAGEYPELGRGEAFARAAEEAREQLRSAAVLSVEADPLVPGATGTVRVRVENQTGHKLPTGYPEGRLCWLEVRILDGSGQVLLHSGVYDTANAERVDDPQLRAYEIKMGQGQVQDFHFVLQDTLLSDTRIPPRGFRPGPDTQVLGRDYSQEGTEVLAHWDLAPYEIELPADIVGPIQVEAALWYQTSSKAYITFLRDENVTTEDGDYLYDVWERYGRSEPVEMATASGSFELSPPEEEEESVLPPEDDGKGCGCASGSPGAPALPILLVPVLAGLGRRRTRPGPA